MHTLPYKFLGTERPVCGKNRAGFHGAALQIPTLSFYMRRADSPNFVQAVSLLWSAVVREIGTHVQYSVNQARRVLVGGSFPIVPADCVGKRQNLKICPGSLTASRAEGGRWIWWCRSKAAQIFLWWRAPFFLPQKNQKKQKSSGARGETAEK
jgi:hypothetical protein